MELRILLNADSTARIADSAVKIEPGGVYLFYSPSLEVHDALRISQSSQSSDLVASVRTTRKDHQIQIRAVLPPATVELAMVAWELSSRQALVDSARDTQKDSIREVCRTRLAEIGDTIGVLRGTNGEYLIGGRAGPGQKNATDYICGNAEEAVARNMEK
ncbi:MAG TPA: hypothetical protein VHG28_13370 [Longimicrobiaceae bacterium]|nr:hypothetical protein [Longimicrobiaceae bacterium]